MKGSCLGHRFPYWFCQCCNSQSLVEGCTAASVISETKAFLSQKKGYVGQLTVKLQSIIKTEGFGLF